MAFSAGFDGQQFYYQSGMTRKPLLDATKLPKELTEAILRHLPALGTDAEAMGESLILLSTMALTFEHVPQVLFVGTGGRSLFSHLASLLRMRFSAQAREWRMVLAAGRPTAREHSVPEALICDSVAALPALVAGYDVIIVIDDGTFDAAAAEHALAALRLGGHVFCLTARQSVLTAVTSAAHGAIYPVTEHFVFFAGKTSKLRPKHGKQDSHRVAFSPLPPAPARTLVFLPYKAAMWDCLESIWRAAAADPSTRAYVVPIPFAEKNPDGTVRDWQYEGGRLPEGVPVVDWREIDLAALHPDAVFIHNPFDDCNNVTTVDARYYTTELKKITRKLIYVPYYATGGWIYPELVTPPGYQTADHVIVENDADRAKFEQFYPAPPVPPGKFWGRGHHALVAAASAAAADAPQHAPRARGRLRAARRRLPRTGLVHLRRHARPPSRHRLDGCLLWRLRLDDLAHAGRRQARARAELRHPRRILIFSMKEVHLWSKSSSSRAARAAA
ncbi:MAG: hypothetical protein MSA50_07025 [Veillonellaceae bacterium]|nr:hypothetical protein [Veillonellaceae bacterium]